MSTSGLTEYTLDQAELDIANLRGQVSLLQEAHSVTDGGVVPNAAGDSLTYTLFSSAGQPSYVNPAGLTMGMSGGQLANVSPVVVTQSTAQTIGTLVIPGGDSVPGSVYQCSAFGFGTAGSTQASNSLTWNQSHGGVGGGSQTTGTSFLTTGQSFRFYMTSTLVCVTNGSSGTFWMGMSLQLTEAGSNILPGGAGQQSAGIAAGTLGAITVDSTIQETIRLQVNWGSTTGSPTLTAVVSWGQRIA